MSARRCCHPGLVWGWELGMLGDNRMTRMGPAWRKGRLAQDGSRPVPAPGTSCATDPDS